MTIFVNGSKPGVLVNTRQYFTCCDPRDGSLICGLSEDLPKSLLEELASIPRIGFEEAMATVRKAKESSVIYKSIIESDFYNDEGVTYEDFFEPAEDCPVCLNL